MINTEFSEEKYKLAEKLTILFACGLFCFGAFLYVKDISIRKVVFGWEDTEKLEKVGSVIDSQGDLKRKTQKDFEFTKTPTNSEIYNFDTIVTDDQTSSTLRLKDGSEIELGPNTMVRIVYNESLTVSGFEGSTQIDIVSGTINAKKINSDIKIKSQQGNLSLKSNQSHKFRKSTVEQVLKRQIPELAKLKALPAPKPVEQVVKKVEEKKEEIKAPVIKVVKPVIKNIYPVDKIFKIKKIVSSPKINVNFKWEHHPQDLHSKVSIFKRGTQQALYTQEFKESLPERNIDYIFKEAGSYYWKIDLIKPDSSVALSKRYNFIISDILDQEIELKRPLIGGVEYFSNEYRGEHADDLDITFRWVPIPGMDKYLLSIYKDKEKKNKILFQSVSGDQFVYKKSKTLRGAIFYQLEGRLEGGFRTKSKVGQFGFEFLPPALAIPKNEIKIDIADLVKNNNQILFTWRKTNFTKHYIFEISLYSDFRKTLLKSRPNDNFTVINQPLQKGKYYWRVTSIGQDLKSEPSVPNHFYITH